MSYRSLYRVLTKLCSPILSLKTTSLTVLAGMALTFGCFQSAHAVENQSLENAENKAAKPLLWTEQEIAAQRVLEERANPAVKIRSSYALGVNRYSLNHASRLIGWQVGESLYFGRAKGGDSGIALVWQRRWNQQVSLSNDGIRLTRHF